MPASIQNGHLIKRCEVCGSPNACIGIGARLRAAMIALASGDVEKAKRLLGKWYCPECLEQTEKAAKHGEAR